MQQDSLSFQQLALVLSWQAKDQILALVGFFDESGHPKDRRLKYFVLGGVVAASDDWLKLDRHWRKMLADEGLQAIHMTALLRSRSPFTNKKIWTIERRRDLVRRCIRLTGEHLKPRLFVGYTVDLSSGPPGPDVERLYLACFNRVIEKVEKELRQYAAPLHLVFAAHPEVPAPRLALYFDAWRRNYPRFAGFTIDSPARLPPLQLADMVVYFLGDQHRQKEGLAPFYDEIFDKGLKKEVLRLF